MILISIDCLEDASFAAAMLNFDSLRRLFGPRSNFKVGDLVEVRGEEQIMEVIEVLSGPKLKEPLIHCQWTDPHLGRRRNVFKENTLEHFDWDHAYRKLPSQKNNPSEQKDSSERGAA